VFERVRTGYKHRLLGEGRCRRKARVGNLNFKIIKVILLTFKNESASRVVIFLHEGVMWRDGGSGGWIEVEVCCSTSGVKLRETLKQRELYLWFCQGNEGFSNSGGECFCQVGENLQLQNRHTGTSDNFGCPLTLPLPMENLSA